MAQLLLLVLSVYAIMVGYRGHGREFFARAGVDLKGFIPWLVALILLGILAANKDTEKLGKPFLGLVVLGIVVKQWSAVSKNSAAFMQEIKK